MMEFSNRDDKQQSFITANSDGDNEILLEKRDFIDEEEQIFLQWSNLNFYVPVKRRHL